MLQFRGGSTITIFGNGGEYASVTIDGTTYNTASEVFVPIGTVVTISTSSSNYGLPTISLNFETVASVKLMVDKT